MTKAKSLLKKYWSYDAFREGQEEIIDKIIQGKDVLALMPTGGGKSICYQIPGLLKSGKTLVISPLIALIEDQVNQLKSKNIAVVNLSEATNENDLLRIIDNIQYGSIKFIFASPEKLKNSIIQNRLSDLNIELIVLDEAHCISEWGHDFRPAYRKLDSLRKLIPEANILALTATATKKVCKDICQVLDFKEIHFYKSSFDRKNLIYTCFKTFNKRHHVIRLIQRNKTGLNIIYVGSRKKSEALKSFLVDQGISAEAFHGGLSKDEKKSRLDQWMKDKIDVMVATNAFGMGIDKANVTNVIHYDIPNSIENYVQEAGRAGRNGKSATATLLYNPDGIQKYFDRYITQQLNLKDIKQVFSKLNQFFKISYGEGSENSYSFQLSEFCNRYEFKKFKTFQALKSLDAAEIIKVSQNFTPLCEIQLTITPQHYDASFGRHKDLMPIGNYLMRNYGGIYEENQKINLYTVASKLKMNSKTLINRLEKMQALSLISFQEFKHDMTIQFLVPREDERTVNQRSKKINETLELKVKKAKDMHAYVTAENRCRKQMLLAYFGEKKKNNCGKCDFCISLDPLEVENCELEILQILAEKETELEEISLRSSFSHAITMQAMQNLVNAEKIRRNKLQTFYLSKR